MSNRFNELIVNNDDDFELVNDKSNNHIGIIIIKKEFIFAIGRIWEQFLRFRAKVAKICSAKIKAATFYARKN